MNWMIDGANGEDYRVAMRYPALRKAPDEWEIERQLGHRRSPARRTPAQLLLRVAALLPLLATLLDRASTPNA
jgi:hypothetical protein